MVGNQRCGQPPYFTPVTTGSLTTMANGSTVYTPPQPIYGAIITPSPPPKQTGFISQLRNLRQSFADAFYHNSDRSRSNFKAGIRRSAQSVDPINRQSMPIIKQDESALQQTQEEIEREERRQRRLRRRSDCDSFKDLHGRIDSPRMTPIKNESKDESRKTSVNNQIQAKDEEPSTNEYYDAQSKIDTQHDKTNKSADSGKGQSLANKDYSIASKPQFISASQDLQPQPPDTYSSSYRRRRYQIITSSSNANENK